MFFFEQRKTCFVAQKNMKSKIDSTMGYSTPSGVVSYTLCRLNTLNFCLICAASYEKILLLYEQIVCQTFPCLIHVIAHYKQVRQ